MSSPELELTKTAPDPRAATAPRAFPRIEPGTVLKHYEIIRRLGAGGMGIVFLARDTRLGRLVAIKLLLEHNGPAAQRFLTEAQTTAQCRHDNIVVIYDFGEFDGYPYMVLEYLEGRTLREAIQGDTNANVAVELMIPVVRALACAHAMGIVHRDLKPENIFLTNTGQVKVLDFGIAKQISAELAKTVGSAQATLPKDSALTEDGALVGTMPYMSPEQWLAEGIDERTDIWAAGLILFELLTGEHPLKPFAMPELAKVVDMDMPMPSARERRPEAAPLADIIDRCLKKRKDERMGSAEELLSALEALGSAVRTTSALSEDESPFAGLSAFQESDAARFFGRDHEIAAVIGKLRHQELIAIAGPTGAGKSSFVRAGVIPALKRSGRDLDAFVIRPGRRPLAALADVLAFLQDTSADTGASEEADLETITATLRAQPGYLGAKLRARCRKRGPEHRIVLFVDQLEELYTLGTEASERATFAACLEGVADDASSPLRVLLTVRADFLDRLSEDRRLLSEVTQGLVFLPPMTRENLRDALRKPLEAARYAFEDEALCDEMLDGLAGTKSPLPLLQFTATRLWEARDRDKRLLTRQAYRALGGVAGALSTHADSVLSGLTLPEQRLARSILIRLVTPERTRAIVQMDELVTLDDNAASVEQVVHHLASARLVLIESSGEQAGKTVELTHESLIESWGKLRQWLDEDEQDAQFLAQLRNAAKQWDQNGQAEGFLWRDRAALEAGQWLERHRAEQGRETTNRFTKREERYLEAVVRLAERTRRRRRQFTGGIIVFLGLFAFVVSLLGVQARSQAKRADEKAQEAHRSAKEAEKSAVVAKKRTAEARNATRMASAREHLADPTLVLALVREMEPGAQLPPRWRELALWARVQGVASVVLHHQDPVYSAAWSPDGKHIVTASEDKSARVWNADGTGTPLLLEGHQVRVNSAAWSPDGKRLVTASEDKSARVWNADGTGTPLVFEGHQDIVRSAAWSPDGKRIVTASEDRTSRVWNADGTGTPLVLEGHQDTVNSAAWSPDGKHIVTASVDKTVRVWNADGTGTPLVLEGHQDHVTSAAFSPDGKRIVTASYDKSARVWNADGTGTPLVLEGHQDIVWSAAWSPDGKRIVTASEDRTVRFWNADGTGKPVVFEGHQGPINSAAFSADGKRIVTVSDDKSARVWNAGGTGKPLVLEGHQSTINSAAWSPDGKRIVTASYDKSAQVWNADGTGKSILFEGHQDSVNSAAFSPDGKRIVTASYDKSARVWNADGTGTPLLLEGHKDSVNSAAWSPDGKCIVTASDDKSARVWNADGTGQPLVLEGHKDRVYSAAFSPDGKRIVTASGDKSARVWSADGTGPPLVLEGHKDVVYSAVWSPDSKRIVTASFDKSARVWNADGTGPPLVLEGHSAAVGAGAAGGGAWSPDGTQIVTLSEDTTLRIWNADGTGDPAILRIPEIDAFSAAFSPDGTRIVTASHSGRDPVTGKMKYWVTIWPRFQRFTSLDDPALWTATRYCPPIELRMELLGVSEEVAAEELARCQARVAEAFERVAGRP